MCVFARRFFPIASSLLSRSAWHAIWRAGGRRLNSGSRTAPVRRAVRWSRSTDPVRGRPRPWRTAAAHRYACLRPAPGQEDLAQLRASLLRLGETTTSRPQHPSGEWWHAARDEEQIVHDREQLLRLSQVRVARCAGLWMCAANGCDTDEALLLMIMRACAAAGSCNSNVRAIRIWTADSQDQKGIGGRQQKLRAARLCRGAPQHTTTAMRLSKSRRPLSGSLADRFIG